MNSTKQTRTNQKKKNTLPQRTLSADGKIVAGCCYMWIAMLFFSVLLARFNWLNYSQVMIRNMFYGDHNKAKNLQLSTWWIHGFKIELWHDDERSVYLCYKNFGMHFFFVHLFFFSIFLVVACAIRASFFPSRLKQSKKKGREDLSVHKIFSASMSNEVFISSAQ